MSFPTRKLMELHRLAQEFLDAPPSQKSGLGHLLHKRCPDLVAMAPAFFARYDHAETKAAKTQLGYDLEALVALLFAGLRGSKRPQSFRSTGSQLDLLVEGESGNPIWEMTRSFLGMPAGRSDVLIEVKATQAPVDAAQMLRMCGLIESHFQNVGLGVFVSVSGATGHPKPGGRRVLGVRDARLHQLLFTVRTKVPIVVLDKADIHGACSDDVLLDNTLNRIREMQALHGFPRPSDDAPTAVDLPEHMKLAADWHNQVRSGD